MYFNENKEEKIKKLKEWGMYTPTNDVIFKYLFGREQNKKLLEGLIKAFLDLEVEIQEVQEESTIPSSYIGGKEFRLDILAKTKEGMMIDIEVQNKDYKEMPKRMVLYPSRIESNELKRGEEYGEVKRVISMWIFKEYFDLTKEDEEYVTTWNWREKSSQKVLTDEQEIDIVELGKIKKYMEEGKISPKSNIGMWTRFLLNPGEIGEEDMKENETISTAKQEYEKSMKSEPLLDDAFYFALKRWEDAAIKKEMRETGLAEGLAEGRAEGKAQGIIEGRAEGLAKGRTEGRAEGERKNKIETAKKMLAKGKQLNEIMEFTELTEEELKNIDNLE